MALRTKINDETAKRDYGANVVGYVQKTKEQVKLEAHTVLITWNMNP